MLNNIGLPGLLVFLLISLIFYYPIWRLLPKFGVSKIWTLACFIPAIGPLVMIILLYVMAFRDPVPTIGAETFS